MILKIVGSILIVSASFYCGCILSQKLYKRKDFLLSLKLFLNTLETSIRFDNSDIFTLVNKSALATNIEEFEMCSKSNNSFQELWDKSQKNLSKKYSLNNKDLTLLKQFGSKLGKTDLEGQLKHLQLYITLFDKQIEDASQLIVKKSKLYKTMGFFVGTALALMII